MESNTDKAYICLLASPRDGIQHGQQAGAMDSIMNGSKPPPPGFGILKRADFNHFRLIDT